MRFVAPLAGIALASALSACGSEDLRPNEANVSRQGGTLSHNTGQNCVSCHREGGEAKGWFTVAGTVYETDRETPYPNVLVELTSKELGRGETVASIEVDANGNFFTTERIDIADGLYPAVITPNGSSFKGLITTDGACSSCHGVTTDRLFGR